MVCLFMIRLHTASTGCSSWNIIGLLSSIACSVEEAMASRPLLSNNGATRHSAIEDLNYSDWTEMCYTLKMHTGLK